MWELCEKQPEREAATTTKRTERNDLNETTDNARNSLTLNKDNNNNESNNKLKIRLIWAIWSFVVMSFGQPFGFDISLLSSFRGSFRIILLNTFAPLTVPIKTTCRTSLAHRIVLIIVFEANFETQMKIKNRVGREEGRLGQRMLCT